MNILQKIPARIGWSLVAVFAILVSQHFGFLGGDELFEGGALVFAGLGNIDELTSLIEEQGEVFKAHMEKLQRMDDELLALQKAMNRPNIGGSYRSSANVEESRKQLSNYMRAGIEIKGMESQDDPSGGYLDLPVFADSIGTMLRNPSAVRRLVGGTNMSVGGVFEEIVSTSNLAYQWVGEKETRNVTDSTAFALVRTPLFEVFAQPEITQRLLDDSAYDVAGFLTNELNMAFAIAEDDSFMNGVGVTQPLGLTQYPTVATSDATRVFGTIQHVKSGAASALATSKPLDAIIELFYSLAAPYRDNATWLMNSDTARILSQQCDKDDNYLWSNRDVRDGQPPSLMGRPIQISEYCPSINTGTLPLWLADWQNAIRFIERPGVRLLRDPYVNKPHVRFYCYARRGFSLRNSQAVKVLKISA